MLIYMFLKPGEIEKGQQLYSGQGGVQTVLLILAVTCVPILLLLKPLYLRWEHNRARAMGYRGIGETSRVSALDDDGADGHRMDGGRDSMGSDGEGVAMITQDIGDEEHEEFEFSEVMIHQTIHTIGKLGPFLSADSVPNVYRILPQLRLTHGILPSSLGTLSRPSAIVDRLVDHDYRQRVQADRRPSRPDDGHHLLHVVLPHHRRPVRHGRHERHVAQSEAALGGGDV